MKYEQLNDSVFVMEIVCDSWLDALQEAAAKIDDLVGFRVLDVVFAEIEAMTEDEYEQVRVRIYHEDMSSANSLFAQAFAEAKSASMVYG